MSETNQTADYSLEQMISWLLLVGVLLSASVLLVGGVIFLWHHGMEPVADRTVFTPEPAEYSRPWPILEATLEGKGRAIIQLGLVFLIATPIVRVAFSALVFARKRDRTYTVIELIVLAVLLVGLFGGLVGH